MKIVYLGHSCFYIESEIGIKIITDPYTGVGYEMPKGLKADIVTISHGHFDHNFLAGVEAERVINQAGRHIYQGIEIIGENSWHDNQKGALRGKNILFKYEFDGCKICHFGDLGEAYSEELAEKIKDTDIWLIPIGGTYTIDAKQAREYIEKLKPKTVIPMHYLPQDGALDIDKASVFLGEMQGYEIETYKTGVCQIKKKDIQKQETKIVYMERAKEI